MDDSTNCPVCFEPYEETGDHLPRLLPCTHTLCHTCVSEMIHRNTLVCPQDRQAHAAVNGAGSFPQNKYILNNLRKNTQQDDSENYEMCTAHRKKKFFYCKGCKVVLCPVCILQKHQGHNIIDIFREQTNVANLIDDLNKYKGKLLAAREDVNEECTANITKLKKKRLELFKTIDGRIAHVDRSLATLDDIKEKDNARTTAKEAITKLQAVESIKMRIEDDLQRPMKYTAYGVAEVDTTVYLAGKKGACSRMMNYMCIGNSSLYYPLADLGGCVPGARPPHGTQFFLFHIHFHQKVPTSEVHAPLNGCTPPPTGNPGSATVIHVSLQP